MKFFQQNGKLNTRNGYASFCEVHFFGLLRDLYEGTGFVLDYLDETTSFANYHPGSAIGHQNFRLPNKNKHSKQTF